MTQRPSDGRSPLPEAPRSLAAAPAGSGPGGHDGLPPGRVRELFETAAADGRLAAMLLEVPPDEREELIRRDPVFHRLTLAKMFALRAEDALGKPGEPGTEAEDSAVLAVAIASTLPEAAGDQARRTAALGEWLLGKTFLRQGHLAAAEASFERILVGLAGSAPCDELGLAWSGLAQARWDRKRYLEAATFFAMAALIFSRLERDQQSAACHAQRGFVLLAAGELMLARGALRSALERIDTALAPSLSILVLLGRSACEEALGSPDAAAESIERARAVIASLPGGGRTALARWWQALAAKRAGQDALAETLVDGLRVDLLASGGLIDAARATFHLALLRIGTGRADAVPRLATDLAEAFPEDGEPWAAEIQELADIASARPRRYDAMVRRLALRLGAEAQRAPRPQILPPSIGQLADRLLRDRGENEEALGVAAGE
jgi:tetratricopeptide (TPR) repeat protein